MSPLLGSHSLALCYDVSLSTCSVSFQLSHSDNNGQYTSEFLVHLLSYISQARSIYSTCDIEQLQLSKRYLETVIRLLNAVQRISPPIDLSAFVERLGKEEQGKTEVSKGNSVVDSQLCFETCRQSATSMLSSVSGLFDQAPSHESIELLTTLASLVKLLADLPIYSVLESAGKRS